MHTIEFNPHYPKCLGQSLIIRIIEVFGFFSLIDRENVQFGNQITCSESPDVRIIGSVHMGNKETQTRG